MHHLSDRTQKAIDKLLSCSSVCAGMVFTHCLEVGGEHSRPQHIRLMVDCAELCRLTADALARKSQIHNRLCDLCADVCETCKVACEQIGGMEVCVAACAETALLCRELARPEHREILEMASKLPPGPSQSQ